MTYYVFGFIIALLSFCLQVWPRINNRYFGVDTWRHLMYADFVRKNGKLPESITDKYIVSGPFGYPPVIILLLSFFPKTFVDEYQFLFSPFFDAINNYIIFVSVGLLTGDIKAAIFAELIAALIPIIVMEASNLSTRSLSYLVFTGAIFPLLLFAHTGLLVWLFLAGLSLYLLFFTHRFALQAYTFVIVGLSIFMRQPLYFVFFFVVSGLVFLTGGDLYKAVLREHIGMLAYWRNNISLRFAHQFRGVPKKKTKDFVVNIYMLSIKNPMVSILGSNPWLGYYIVIIALSSLGIIKVENISSSPLYSEFQAWIISLVFAAILVLGIKSLRFLGEGHRYVEYITFPLAYILGVSFSAMVREYGAIVIVLFVLACLINLLEIIYLQWKTILHDRGRTITKEFWQSISYLNKQNDVRLAIFPLSIGDAMMYFIKGRVLTADNVFGLLQLMDIYPMVTSPMSEIIKKYKISYIFFDKRYVTIKELRLKKFTTILDENDYMLIKV